jgi:hypothetical protein
MSDTEFRKVVDAMIVEQPNKPRTVLPNRFNEFTEPMWLYKFQISISKVSFRMPTFVPDSVPAEKRENEATDSLKFFIKALAQKIEEVF